MAIYIEIEKILEKDEIGYYHVFTENFGGADFYIGINKKLRKISCYLSNDFSKPIRIIDLNDPNELVGQLPGVEPSIIGRIIMKVNRAFKLDYYPEYLSYEA